jgi:hypothetical protein
MSQTIPVASDVRVTITQVGSDLQVRSWLRNEIQVDCELGTLRAEPDAHDVTLSARGDCVVYVPEMAQLEIGTIGADAKVSGVRGNLTINTVGADIVIRECGKVSIGRVGADARVRQSGDLRIESVGADLTVTQCEGNVTVGNVGADAYLREVSGDCVVEHVGADLVLDITFTPEHTYRFASGSDVICRIDPGSNVTFNVSSQAEVTVDVLGSETMKSEAGWRVTVGAGMASVAIDSPSDVRIVDSQDAHRPFVDFDLVFDHIFDRTFEESARAAERVSEKFKRQAERAAEQLRRQGEQLRQHGERARRESTRASGPWNWSWGAPPPPPDMPSEPVSDAERLAILRMVESKQITVDEAERLLAALNGQGKARV